MENSLAISNHLGLLNDFHVFSEEQFLIKKYPNPNYSIYGDYERGGPLYQICRCVQGRLNFFKVKYPHFKTVVIELLFISVSQMREINSSNSFGRKLKHITQYSRDFFTETKFAIWINPLWPACSDQRQVGTFNTLWWLFWFWEESLPRLAENITSVIYKKICLVCISCYIFPRDREFMSLDKTMKSQFFPFRRCGTCIWCKYELRL